MAILYSKLLAMRSSHDLKKQVFLAVYKKIQTSLMRMMVDGMNDICVY